MNTFRSVTDPSALAIFDRYAKVARGAGRLTLSEPDGKAILAKIGLAVPRGVFITDPQTIEGDFGPLKFPVAVKGVSPQLIHKSDAGGVRLDLQDFKEVRSACIEMRDAVGDIFLDGFLIEEMAPPGVEVIIGGLIDPQFGPVIMVGLGGVFVEILADVSFRICPIDSHDVADMLNELQAGPLLDGIRGGAVASRAAIIEAMLHVGGEGGILYQRQTEIEALDINPLIVSEDGAVVADVRIVLQEMPAPLLVDTPVDSIDSIDEIRDLFRPLFEPSTIAVVGASTTRRMRSNAVIDQLLQYGFARDKLYPIHPTASEIDGLPAYKSFQDTPEPVDYAYIAIPAARVANLLSDAKGRLRIAQVTAGGFAEVGRHDLQDMLVAAVHESGARLIGPNCNGAHSPRGKLTFCYDCEREEGSVGIILQSGGLGMDTIRRGNHRGLRFSGVITVGNCADIGVTDLLAFYLNDLETKVIGMYLEGAPEGRRLFNLLRQRPSMKPVVILKGGRSERGGAAVVTHTGTLSGDDRIWEALSRQTGVVLATSLDDFIDKLLALQSAEPRIGAPTVRAVLLGNGGGASVLGVDSFARAGVDITPFTAKTIQRLEALGLDPGAAYSNPVDLPQPVLVAREGLDTENVLRIICENEDPQAIVMHVNLSVVMSLAKGGDDPLMNLLDVAVRVNRAFPGKAHFLLVLRSDGSLAYEEAKIRYRARALECGISTYDELPAAANAVAAIATHENYTARERRNGTKH
jgi:acyl-CoA synthetase (NDP forming)